MRPARYFFVIQLSNSRVPSEIHRGRRPAAAGAGPRPAPGQGYGAVRDFPFPDGDGTMESALTGRPCWDTLS